MQYGKDPPPEQPTERGPTRRGFLRQAAFMAVGLAGAESLAGAGLMFWPIKAQGFGGVVPVPKGLSEIKVDAPPFMVREGKFYLVRLPEGLVALYWKCTHLGCTVPWSDTEAKFHCPCHGSVYLRSGQNVAGPAPRPLDLMEIRLDGDRILVNTGHIKQRARHEPDHAFRLT